MLGWHILNSGYNPCLVVDSRSDQLRVAVDLGFKVLNIDPRKPGKPLSSLLVDKNLLPVYTSNDQCVSNLNLILQEAGFFFCPQEVVELVEDKYAVLFKLREHGLIKRDFGLRPLNKSCFVKPRKGASSVGVKFVSHPSELLDDHIYESPLVGVEYSVDGLVDSNSNAHVDVGKKFKFRGNPFSAISSAVIYSKEFSRVIAEYFFKVIKVLNLKNTAVHGEVILTACGPELVEISARQTGMTGSLILPSRGFNFTDELKQIQLGKLEYEASKISFSTRTIIYFFYERARFVFNDSTLESHGFSRLTRGRALDKPLRHDDLGKTGFEVLEYRGDQMLLADEINNILRWLENA